MLAVEKPGSPLEILETLNHSGVKGMRWGVRKSSQDFARKHPTGRQRADAIYRARAAQIKRNTDFATERDPAKRANLKKAFLNNPDRVTALRMTRGEKVVFTLLGIAVPPAGVGLAVGSAARVAVRRSIEKKQSRK